MTTIQFTKMHGIGNDFVVVDLSHQHIQDLSQFAVDVCDRRFGVGGDGLLTIERTEPSDARMRMFNPDGSEDFCGNGLRCVVRYIVERWLGEGKSNTEIVVETLAGSKKCIFCAVGPTITIDLGEPSFEPNVIPVLLDNLSTNGIQLQVLGESYILHPVSTGTTHSIIVVNELPTDDLFSEVSPILEYGSVFPERTSIMWTKVTGPNSISLRIWERGAGETLGCGTGATSAAIVSIRLGLTSSPVAVQSKGGCLTIDWQPGNPAILTGPAEFVYDGSVIL